MDSMPMLGNYGNWLLYESIEIKNKSETQASIRVTEPEHGNIMKAEMEKQALLLNQSYSPI